MPSAEWLYEAGIGEARAALIENGTIVDARIERDGSGPRYGHILRAKLTRKAGRAGQGELMLDGGHAALLSPIPHGLTEGASLIVEIVREAIPEIGNPKLALARPSEAPPHSPGLIDELTASGVPVRIIRPHAPDALEDAGWSELVEQAETGLVPFSGGLLRIAVTSAMTVIDVDGDLPLGELANRGAAAAGAAIRRFDIGGSIGIDLPSVPSRQARQAAAEALDQALPQPFERTAVNGFGFVQVIRRRVRPSLLELVQADPVEAGAVALLRRLEREGQTGPGTVTVPAPVARLLADRPDWTDELARRCGRVIRIEPS